MSDLRIVLLGNRAAGKTSLANLIISHAEPHVRRTARCVKMQGDFAGRHITVVDTPGWWKNYLVKDTPEFQKQEIVLSVAHCPPGPHAVLLVIRVDTLYKERNRVSAKEHLELLSQRVWNHTIVAFTYRDQLQELTLGKQMGSEGESFLLWLVERCGHRYHVVNVDRAIGAQVTGLLEKIDAMVVGNGGCHFEMDRKWLHKVEGMMTKRYLRANQRRKMVQEEWEAPLTYQGDKSFHKICLTKNVPKSEILHFSFLLSRSQTVPHFQYENDNIRFPKSWKEFSGKHHSQHGDVHLKDNRPVRQERWRGCRNTRDPSGHTRLVEVSPTIRHT